jgi:hypothetical protein
MFADLVQAAGLWFVIACAFQVVVVFFEQAGAARSPEEEKPQGGFGALAGGIAALLAPGLLLMHGYFRTELGPHESLRLFALGAPIAASVLGGLLGALFSALFRSASTLMRAVAPWLAVAGLILAVYATLPSIVALIGAIQNGGVMILPNEA